MNTMHVVLDIDVDGLGGAYCSYCGQPMGSSYDKEKGIYEFKCMCDLALTEIELIRKVEAAQENLNKFYHDTSAIRALKSSEVKRDNYKKYADILTDMHKDLIKEIKGEKLDE